MDVIVWNIIIIREHKGMDIFIKISWRVNSSPHGQSGTYFTDDIFRCIFVDEKVLYFG